MKILKDYNCPSCGTTQERFLDATVESVACQCGELARRIISYPTIKLEGITGDFPGAHDRWARIREENARIKASRT